MLYMENGGGGSSSSRTGAASTSSSHFKSEPMPMPKPISNSNSASASSSYHSTEGEVRSKIASKHDVLVGNDSLFDDYDYSSMSSYRRGRGGRGGGLGSVRNESEIQSSFAEDLGREFWTFYNTLSQIIYMLITI
jgi:hypothetical protein